MLVHLFIKRRTGGATGHALHPDLPKPHAPSRDDVLPKSIKDCFIPFCFHVMFLEKVFYEQLIEDFVSRNDRKDGTFLLKNVVLLNT